MNRSEKIMLSHKLWVRNGVRAWLRAIRGDRRQYACDEARYYVDSYPPGYREGEPNQVLPVMRFTWSLAPALRWAYQQRKKGWTATIYDNQNDEVVLHARMAKWQLSLSA